MAIESCHTGVAELASLLLDHGAAAVETQRQTV